jgi:DNA helicase-2/ATP-dependent DNA helicase PcrA
MAARAAEGLTAPISPAAKDELYLTYPLVAAPRDRERVVMKASRFLEELPPEPEIFERWQLEEGSSPPPLGP